MEEQIRILLVEDSTSDAMLMETALRETEIGSCQMDHVGLLGDALSLMSRHAYDLVILDLGLPDSQGEQTLTKMLEAHPNAAIVVFTGTDDKNQGLQAIRNGAQDYLNKSHVSHGVLAKTVLYALERQRRQSLLSREAQTMERMGSLSNTHVTAEVFSGDRLFESIPEEMERLVGEYASTLNHALDGVLHNNSALVSERCRDLGERLGFLRASPRDIVEIHRRALAKVIEGVTSKKADAYAEEGRMVALQVMGYLAGFYRNYSISPQGKPKGRENG